MPRDHHALAGFLAGRMRQPFAWGVNDCASLAFDAVAAQTGEDKLADLRGYASARGAAKRLAANGGLRGICDARLAPVGSAMAQRGDIGLVLNQDGEETLVVIDGQLLVGVGLGGAIRLPRAALLCAWSAG